MSIGYISYTHVERLNHPNVDGLLMGECYVFPKLDGTNGVIWLDENGKLCCGSRRLDITDREADNHGFREEMNRQFGEGKLQWMEKFPYGTLFYGEWLVPHSLKTYRDEAWRELYIFDVRNPANKEYLHYNEWSDIIRSGGGRVLEPLAIINNPTLGDVNHVRDTANTYLISENEGVGEGVVVKNYSFRNHVGSQVWGKSVRNDFKDKNREAFGPVMRDGTKQIELEIAENYVTEAFVSKTRAKVEMAVVADEVSRGSSFSDAEIVELNRPHIIPRLLQTVYSELITEEAWSFVKEMKDPTIDFKLLRRFVMAKTKQHAADLFS